MKIAVLTAAAIACAAGVAHAGIVADAVEDFHLGQGGNGWSYGYYDGAAPTREAAWTQADFAEMTVHFVLPPDIWWVNPTAGKSGFWTHIRGDFMHPNAGGTSRSDEDQWAVRRWTSDLDGLVTLSGIISDVNEPALGDGTTASIVVDGVEVLSYYVAPGDRTGLAYSVDVSVTSGSVVDFIVKAGETAGYDTTRFSATITTIPTPAGVMALLAAAPLAGRRRRCG